jgi:hypothetical protein
MLAGLPVAFIITSTTRSLVLPIPEISMAVFCHLILFASSWRASICLFMVDVLDAGQAVMVVNHFKNIFAQNDKGGNNANPDAGDD